MRAKTQLSVKDDMWLSIHIEMTVGEAKALLEATKDVVPWPMSPFRQVLSQSLSKASDAYFSEHVVSP